MLGIGVCACGLTDVPCVPLLAYDALVIAVFIIHMAASNTTKCAYRPVWLED